MVPIGTPISISKSIAGPLFSASLAYVSGGGTPENLGPIVYDLKQQAGVQAAPGSMVASVVLGEYHEYCIISVYNLMNLAYMACFVPVWLIVYVCLPYMVQYCSNYIVS